jgi:hypothetical protein
VLRIAHLVRRLRWLAVAFGLCTATTAGAQAEEGEGGATEHTIVVGVGGAAELELRDGSLHPGANVMLEWDAVENWLELEFEASVLAGEGVEMPIGLLAKKPFHLTRWAEVMVGIGPEVAIVLSPKAGNESGPFYGGQVAVDFMFWPSKRFGLWLEPAYDFVFRDGVSQGIGSTGGLLVGW